MTTSSLENPELETMVDRFGLRMVLEQLAHICNEKAEHVATNWQDVATARVWRQHAAAVHSAANRVLP